MNHKLHFDGYTMYVGMGGYEYRTRREPPPPADDDPELVPVVLGTTHAVWLHDEKNCWYVGQVDTYQQALTLIGFDLMRHAGQMAEMAPYDTQPTEAYKLMEQLCQVGYHIEAEKGGGWRWVHAKGGTRQQTPSPTDEGAWAQARLDAVRQKLIKE